MILQFLLAAGLKLKAKKCHLKKVVYLGHVISEAGIATDPEKTKIVESWPVPTNVFPETGQLQWLHYLHLCQV
jgi:hypothetical protein